MKPFGLWRADLLKLRRRRGLVALVALLTIGAQVITYGILALLHWFSPETHGAAGGVENLGHGLWLLNMLGGVAALVVGASAGADDLGAGVFRELVATGRSRLALFASRLPGGLAFVLPFAAAAYAIAAAVSVFGAGSHPEPSWTLVLETGTWAFTSIAFWYVLGLGVASVTGSRSYSLASLLAFRLVVGAILTSISWLAWFRELVPAVAFEHFAPDALRRFVFFGDPVGSSGTVAASVIVGWLALALAAGAWRVATQDA
jgi:hypothetical protein